MLYIKMILHWINVLKVGKYNYVRYIIALIFTFPAETLIPFFLYLIFVQVKTGFIAH